MPKTPETTGMISTEQLARMKSTAYVINVAEQTGVELDRKQLSLDEPIKTLGTHLVPAKLHSDVEFPVTVEVVAG
jgi:ribosomal protein L9